MSSTVFCVEPNMVCLLKYIKAGKDAGILLLEKEPRAVTNFIS